MREEPAPEPIPDVVTPAADRQAALERVEREILGEKAATLGRAGARLEAALARAAALRRAFEAAAPEARAAIAADYETARRAARDARRVLIIQREAIGLRGHRVVDQGYPEPGPLSDS
jgi:hypothetical protein